MYFTKYDFTFFFPGQSTTTDLTSSRIKLSKEDVSKIMSSIISKFSKFQKLVTFCSNSSDMNWTLLSFLGTFCSKGNYFPPSRDQVLLDFEEDAHCTSKPSNQYNRECMSLKILKHLLDFALAKSNIPHTKAIFSPQRILG